MNHILFLLTGTLLATFTHPVISQEKTGWPSDELIENAQKKPVGTGENPFELDTFIVTAERFSFEQEVALRLIRQALERPRSNRRRDKETWTCRFHALDGLRRKTLQCARNGDLMAMSPNPTYPTYDKDKSTDDQFGTIMEYHGNLNEKEFRSALSGLPGTGEFDREFVSMALAGYRPPRDIPTSAEMDDFAAAYQQVLELDRSGAGDENIVNAIAENGFSVSRYNRIVDLIETYQSLENEVAFRLGTLERPRE